MSPVSALVWWLGRTYDITTCTLGAFVRWCAGGVVASGQVVRPALPIKLYDMEGCPFCRRVREVLSILDIDVIVYPCPRASSTAESRFRPAVVAAGGKAMFPYLVDPNTGTSMYESASIVEYLWATYGKKARPPPNYWLADLPVLRFLTLAAASLVRPFPTISRSAVPSRQPKELLELWSYECSPFSRLVREALCALQLPYLLHNVPYGSTDKRREFRERNWDRLSSVRKSMHVLQMVQVPFLYDPNTGAELLESYEIIAYLQRTYGLNDTAKQT